MVAEHPTTGHEAVDEPSRLSEGGAFLRCAGALLLTRICWTIP